MSGRKLHSEREFVASLNPAQRSWYSEREDARERLLREALAALARGLGPVSAVHGELLGDRLERQAAPGGSRSSKNPPVTDRTAASTRIAALAWPGLHASGSLLLPLPAAWLAVPTGATLRIGEATLHRKAEFHITVLNRALGSLARARLGERAIERLFHAQPWQPRRTGRYLLLKERKTAHGRDLDIWSVIERLQLPAMHAFRGRLAEALAIEPLEPAPHVTHYVVGDPAGIGVPDEQSLARYRVADVSLDELAASGRRGDITGEST